MTFVACEALMTVHCNRTGAAFTELEQASREAAAIVTTQQPPFKDAIQQAKKAVEEAVSATNDAIQEATTTLQHFLATPQRRREELKRLTDGLNAKRSTLEEKAAAMATWKIGKLVCFEDLLACGKAIVKQGFDCFESEFIDPDGTHHETMQCCQGAKLFNPLVAEFL
jgi:hypothetical protein